MSAEAAMFVRSWPVGRFTATLSVPRVDREAATAAAVIEWAPHVPQRLSEEEIAEYRAGRNRALAEIARVIGGNVGLVEL